MAVYKLFPNKDTFIYSEIPIGNAGYDEMLEIGGYPILDIGQTCRTLIQFETQEIQNVINNKAGATPVVAHLNIKLASAYETPTSHSVLAYPMYEYWDGGVGKFADYPFDKSGCSWRYAKANMSGSWTLPHNTIGMPANVTGSYSSTYPGGGVWYTGSNGINLEASQSFETNSVLDLDINVTNATLMHYSGTIDNNGFILKFNDDVEFNLNSAVRHKFYSSNTNTIYPPTLDIKWDDSIYLTGSLNLLTTDIAEIDITNNKGEYPNFGKQRFRLLARPKYPVRTFTTGSIYKQNYALPSGSYWGLRDEFTQEMVIPFDENYTKISCDSTGPYFDIYMDGVQPERYYRILVKTDIDGTTAVINRDNTFKVVRNG
jgi:hypothetical protein